MNDARWGRVRALFEAATGLDAEARRALLEREPDDEIRSEAESLLRAAQGASASLRGVIQGAAAVAATGTAAPASADPLIGERFVGRYRIDALIGEGGMGAVYRATQLSVGRSVAIKVLRPEIAGNEKVIRRFEQEAKAIAALSHPNIIALYDFGHDDQGRMYLVMEHLEGEPLASLLEREAPLTPARTVHIARQVLEALAEAHACGVVHRDLKPENVFVLASAGRRKDAIKLLDFGIAKTVRTDTGEAKKLGALTDSGTIIGSPRYMAPEQARGESVSVRTDLYALGAIMYECLAGRPVFEARNLTDLLVAHCVDAPPPIVVGDSELAGPLIELVFRCLAKGQEDRPASAEAMIAAIDAMPGELVVHRVAGHPAAGRRVAFAFASDTDISHAVTARAASRRRALLWTTGAALLAAAAAVALVLASSSEAPPPAAVETVAAASAPAPATSGLAEAAAELARSPGPPDTSADAAAADAMPQAATPEDSPVATPKSMTVVVDTNPRGARVSRDGTPLGTAPLAVSWRDGETPPRIVLERGKQTLTIDLLPSDAGTTRTITFPPPAPRPRPTAKETAPPADDTPAPGPKPEPEAAPIFEILE